MGAMATDRSHFVTVRVSRATHDDLYRQALQLSARVGRRLSLTAAVDVIVAFTGEHLDDLVSALAVPAEPAAERTPRPLV